MALTTACAAPHCSVSITWTDCPSRDCHEGKVDRYLTSLRSYLALSLTTGERAHRASSSVRFARRRRYARRSCKTVTLLRERGAVE
jgi:hypothetical protein